jgi:hypothetical protein
MRHSYCMLLMVVLLLALFTCLVPPIASASPILTADEQRRLERGDVVVLNLLPPGGSGKAGQGGTAVSLVHANPAAVWRLLIDYRGHSGLYPRVVYAEVLDSDATHVLVRYVVGVGPFSFGFHVNNYPNQARSRLAWRLARERRNDLFRDSWGYWEVQPDARGAILTYAMAARTALPAFLTRGAERGGLVETIKAVRARAERGQ